MKHFNFFRLFLVLWMLLCNVFVFADDLITEQVVVNVEEPGTLPDKISDADKDRITDLKIIGELNGTDVRLIREMAGVNYYNKETLGNLRKLDLLEASFVSGGDSYCQDIYYVPVVGGYLHLNSSNCNYFLSHSNKIESVKLGDRITEIGSYAFYCCKRLTNIELSSKVTSIETEAFAGCSSLRSFIVPKQVHEIEYATFSGCEKLEDVKLPDGLVKISTKAFQFCSNLSSLTIPASLEAIDHGAFDRCDVLSVINISSLESWMKTSLADCWPNGIHLMLNGEEIENLVIPSSVKIIPDYVFNNCRYIKTIFIPESVVKIGSGAFEYCESLLNIDVPNKVNSLGSVAFGYCKSLKSISIPEGIEKIAGFLFTDCVELKTIEVPKTVSEIGNSAFSNCVSLESFSIPKNVKSIDTGAFDGCSGLRFITCYWDSPIQIDIKVFDYLNKGFNFKNCTLIIPKGAENAYSSADVWKDFGTFKIMGDDGLHVIPICETPLVTYTSGSLSFESSTPGAEYHYTIKDADVATDKYNTDGKVLLNGKLDISVYATADGYKASDKETATLYWLNAEGGDDTNNINLVKTRGVMVTTDSDITISGLNDGEVVTFYSVDGVNLGSAKAVQGVLHFAKPNESIVIAKIKGNDLKIAIK